MEYSIFKANLIKDKGKILQFWQDNSFDWLEEKFNLFYNSNPFGETICWLMDHEYKKYNWHFLTCDIDSDT